MRTNSPKAKPEGFFALYRDGGQKVDPQQQPEAKENCRCYGPF